MAIGQRDHAVVIGASVGGLIASRMLCRHFRKVTLIERDRLPTEAEQRRGVPQGRHAHALLSSGLGVFDRVFPGFADELIAAGGVPGDPAWNGRWFQEGGYMRRCHSGIRGVMASRPLIECTLRRRVLATPNLQLAEETDALALEFSATRDAVTGVRVKTHGNDSSIPADLVVDAAGRASPVSGWLAQLGFPAHPVERVEIRVGYATRIFRRLSSHLDGDDFAITPPTPQCERGGVLLSIEDGRWICTLIGYPGAYPSTDLAEFREYAAALPSPDIYSVVKDAEPEGEGQTTRFPANVRCRFERLDRHPLGLLRFGDSICSFNPIYGQGMSVSALEAQALDESLSETDGRLAQVFYAKAAKIIDNPWSIAVGTDLRLPHTVGERTAQTRFVNWYMAKLLKGSHRSAALSAAFHQVANLLAPGPSVMRPSIAARVLWAALWPGTR